MRAFKIYSGGEFLTTDRPLEIKNPYNGKLVGKTSLAGTNELEIAITRGLEIERKLQSLPSHKRSEILLQIAAVIKTDRDDFANILSLESAKPIRYALGEVDRAIQTFIVAAEEAKRLPKEYIDLDWTPSGDGKEALIKYFPVGLIAGISPFNYPLNLAVHKIAPAISAGCPIILKPSSSTPLSALKLAQVIDQTNLPKGGLSVLPMDRQTGNLLVTDERFKLLTFTGSPEAGWKMKRDAGKKKVVLELGGNAAVVVTDSADIDQAAAKCLHGGFVYSGQVCIHAQRIYVQDKVFNQFKENFIGGVKKLKNDDPLSPETDISVMIDEANAIRIEEWIHEAIENGATLLTGGKRDGSYYQPTVLTGTNNEMKVCSHEVFGPVVTLESFTDFAKVMDVVNQSRFGLQAGVFTSDLDQMNMAFDRLQVGGVIINDVPTFRVDHMPYGGIKDSGLGREGVKYTILEMMEPKILVKNK